MMPHRIDHYTRAEEVLDHAIEAAGQGTSPLALSVALAEAQVHATLALADATAGRRTGLVWQLDDGNDVLIPKLYANRGAAVDAAVERYREFNPYTDVPVTDTSWRRVEDEDATIELVVRGRATGIVVRELQPEAGA